MKLHISLCGMFSLSGQGNTVLMFWLGFSTRTGWSGLENKFWKTFSGFSFLNVETAANSCTSQNVEMVDMTLAAVAANSATLILTNLQ